MKRWLKRMVSKVRAVDVIAALSWLALLCMAQWGRPGQWRDAGTVMALAWSYAAIRGDVLTDSRVSWIVTVLMFRRAARDKRLRDE